jgi:hypothetical protein
MGVVTRGLHRVEAAETGLVSSGYRETPQTLPPTAQGTRRMVAGAGNGSSYALGSGSVMPSRACGLFLAELPAVACRTSSGTENDLTL